MSFAGKRVLTLESRRGAETAELIRRSGGEPLAAPSMREIPIESNAAVYRFAELLLANRFDTVVFLTGVGTRYLRDVLQARFAIEDLASALRQTTVVSRGPKTSAALREWNVPVTVSVPEPNTWREVLAALGEVSGRQVAVQLYGKPASELIEGLQAGGAEVTEVPVYRWALPEDLAPLREAAKELAAGSLDVTLWTSGQQVVHLLEVARDLDLEDSTRAGIRQSVVASIGPVTSEALREHGIEPDIEASPPKLGFLIKQAAAQCEELLSKRKKD